MYDSVARQSHLLPARMSVEGIASSNTRIIADSDVDRIT